MQSASGSRIDCMAAKNTHCRVIVSVDDREVVLTLVDSNGTKLDEDHFGLAKGSPPIVPRTVARDVYQLLYQCASDATLGDDD
jgi:hypothetical protein